MDIAEHLGIGSWDSDFCRHVADMLLDEAEIIFKAHGKSQSFVMQNVDGKTVTVRAKSRTEATDKACEKLYGGVTESIRDVYSHTSSFAEVLVSLAQVMDGIACAKGASNVR